MSMSDRAKIEEAISSAALCGVTVQINQGLGENSFYCATACAFNILGTKSTCLNTRALVAVEEAISNCYKKAYGGAVN